MSNAQWSQRWAQTMMPNYRTPQLVLTRGEGAVVYDADGNRYLDLVGGLAVNSLGHAHPAVVSAVTEQLSTLGPVSNLYGNTPVVELAERLLAQFGSGIGRAFFANSGAEANEAAFKIARLTGRGKIIACDQGFHGRTMGALALTGQPAKQAPFAPLPDGVVHVPYGDSAALAAAVDADTAAVFLEPIQGEAGVVVPPADYLARARQITADHGALLVLDEVQTGIGRTGRLFAHQDSGIVPDVITLAKGLGGGMPIGAVLAEGHAAELLTAGLHASTFGGNPISAAAALAVLETLEQQELLAQVRAVGHRLSTGITALAHPLIDQVRGAGLLLGVVLTQDIAPQVELRARQAGYLVNPATPNVVRLAPPLILTESQADEFLADFPAILADVLAPETV